MSWSRHNTRHGVSMMDNGGKVLFKVFDLVGPTSPSLNAGDLIEERHGEYNKNAGTQLTTTHKSFC